MLVADCFQRDGLPSKATGIASGETVETVFSNANEEESYGLPIVAS